MNHYIVYVDGLLVGPNKFQIKVGNNGTIGRYAEATIDTKQIDRHPDFVDIVEIRAGNWVRRYRYERSSEEKDEHLFKVVGEEKDEVRFRCLNVPNAF